MISLAELRKDRSKYDAGRKRSGKSGTSTSHGKSITNMDRPILAIDGEGITDERKRHQYILLAASDGSYVSGDSLSTIACFDYLLSLPSNHLIVGFSLNYDICKWIKDIPQEGLAALWKSGTTWNGYTIRYIPSKSFSLKKGDKSVLIYDVFGFFQQSFVKTLQEWKVGTIEQITRIAEMKASRSDFNTDGFEDILAYCLEECTLLVQMMNKLRGALADVDIAPSRWDGAGAVAAAIYRREKVKQYMGRPDDLGKPQGPPDRYSHMIMSAYYGGRFELAQSGDFDDVYSYDIRSAYPYILSRLPCLTHVTYKSVEGYVAGNWNLHYVHWNTPDTVWGPFPFRVEGSRQILFPPEGYGWYHATEVEAAMRYLPGIEVEQTIVITRHCNHVPFAFVPEYFAYRDKLKKAGHQGQLTIKLGLNSLYGKTAQGVGWGDKRPPFQSYLWAGMITAGTRGMLLDAIAMNPQAIIATATDGIISRESLDLDVREGLGGWEENRYKSFFSVQSGVYETWEGVPYAKETKSRGFGKAETDFDSIRAAHSLDPVDGTFGYTTTRFIGLGAALNRSEFWKHFGQWVEMPRSVNFDQVKRYALEENGGRVLWQPKGRPSGQLESAPFEPRSDWGDLWSDNGHDAAFELLVDQYQP